MVIAVTISWAFRKIVSGRSSTTRVSTSRPSWSMPVTARVSRGAAGSGAIRYAVRSMLMAPRIALVLFRESS